MWVWGGATRKLYVRIRRTHFAARCGIQDSTAALMRLLLKSRSSAMLEGTPPTL